MKALVYSGPRDVRVKNVTDAKIERPTDVLVRITSSNICGSDLHMYEGRTDMEEGKVLGHENLGRFVEVGEVVDRIKVGDWVCLPFNVACGFCKNCEAGLTGACLTSNPGTAGAAYGFAGMGPYSGGQAEYLRVPYADFNCLKLPDDAQEKENDYVMLADIFPTGWHATELAGVKPGESVVIYGCGPVGLMAAHAAMIKGASKVMIVDPHPDRLALAEDIGAIAVDYSKGSACIKAFSETDFTEDLKKFDVPTLVLHGDDDQIVPIGAAALHSSKLVRNATLKIYAGAPHGLAYTHNDQLNVDLLAFLKTEELSR
ncbi:MAG TPA: alcohol dehydrogenase catalytic domain-containing protein [Candidatus Dormibacteraeota bacterium]